MAIYIGEEITTIVIMNGIRDGGNYEDKSQNNWGVTKME